MGGGMGRGGHAGGAGQGGRVRCELECSLPRAMVAPGAVTSTLTMSLSMMRQHLHEAWGMGHGAWGMGHAAWGMGHGGMGQHLHEAWGKQHRRAMAS